MSYISTVVRRSDGIKSACAIIDDYYGEGQAAMLIPNDLHYPISKYRMALLLREENLHRIAARLDTWKREDEGWEDTFYEYGD